MYLMKTSRIVAVLCIFCCFFGQESHAFYLIEGGELDPHQLSQIEEQLQQMDQVTKQKQDGSYKPNWNDLKQTEEKKKALETRGLFDSFEKIYKRIQSLQNRSDTRRILVRGRTNQMRVLPFKFRGASRYFIGK